MSITKRSFRALALASLGLAVLGVVIHVLTEDSLPAPLAEYLQAQSEAEPTLNDLLLLALALVFLGVGLVSMVGLLVFWRPARLLAIAATVLGELIVPLAGPTVESAWASMLDDFSSLLWGAVLALAYCSPVSEWFEKKTMAPEPPVGDLRSRWSG